MLLRYNFRLYFFIGPPVFSHGTHMNVHIKTAVESLFPGISQIFWVLTTFSSLEFCCQETNLWRTSDKEGTAAVHHSMESRTSWQERLKAFSEVTSFRWGLSSMNKSLLLTIQFCSLLPASLLFSIVVFVQYRYTRSKFVRYCYFLMLKFYT